MSNIALSLAAAAAMPMRLEGKVSIKDNVVSCEFKEPGMVKTTVEQFPADDLVAYMVGEPGFVVAMSTKPMTKAFGSLIQKNGKTYVKTEGGNIVVNKVAGVIATFQAVEEGSREARAAERAGRVKAKIRSKGARAAKPAAAGKSRRAAKAAAAEAKPIRGSKKRRAKA